MTQYAVGGRIYAKSAATARPPGGDAGCNTQDTIRGARFRAPDLAGAKYEGPDISAFTITYLKI